MREEPATIVAERTTVKQTRRPHTDKVIPAPPCGRASDAYLCQVLRTALPLCLVDMFVGAGALSISALPFVLSNSSLATLGSLSMATAVFLWTMLLFRGLYPAIGIDPVREFQKTVTTSLLAAGFHAAILSQFYTAGVATFSAVILLGLTLSVLLPIGRRLARSFLKDKNWWGVRVLVVGEHAAANGVVESLEELRDRGWQPAGILDVLDLLKSEFDDSRYSGTHGMRESNDFQRISQFAPTNGVYWAIVCVDDELTSSQTLRALGSSFRHLLLVNSRWHGIVSIGGDVLEIADAPGTHVCDRLLVPGMRVYKRVFDLVGAIALLTISLPLGVAIAVAVAITSRGPVFYGQTRIGRGGRRFRAWKFRTMIENADELLVSQLGDDTDWMLEWEEDHKIKDDPRITSLGRILRRTSLDELPQLWNIIRGDMSLVGPRPIVSDEIAKYGQAFSEYTRVLPGLTGMWQVSGRNDTTYSERVKYDSYYVRNWSPWLDLYILGATVRVVLRQEGAY